MTKQGFFALGYALGWFVALVFFIAARVSFGALTLMALILIPFSAYATYLIGKHQ